MIDVRTRRASSSTGPAESDNVSIACSAVPASSVFANGSHLSRNWRYADACSGSWKASATASCPTPDGSRACVNTVECEGCSASGSAASSETTCSPASPGRSHRPSYSAPKRRCRKRSRSVRRTAAASSGTEYAKSVQEPSHAGGRWLRKSTCTWESMMSRVIGATAYSVWRPVLVPIRNPRCAKRCVAPRAPAAETPNTLSRSTSAPEGIASSCANQ